MTKRFIRRSVALVTTASWLPLLLLGSGIVRIPPGSAQQQLPEPQIFDELPPTSSPSPVPSVNVPASPSPSASPMSPGRELNFQAPKPSIPLRTTTPVDNLYRIDVLGDSASLLDQVKQIEPEAFVREEEGVIQAGVFTDQSNAQARVRALADQGIRAKVTTIAAGSDVGTVYSRMPREATPEIAARSRERSYTAYFVVIPGNSRNLSDIVAKVVRLGVKQSAVSEREAPRGSHVAVGPFEERRDAERWSSYLRSAGMDARVYFGR